MASIRKVKKQIKNLPYQETKNRKRKILSDNYDVKKRGLRKVQKCGLNSIEGLLRWLDYLKKESVLRNRIFRNERLRKMYANPFRKRLK